MDGDTTATAALSAFELLMCRSMCGPALLRLGDDLGEGDLDDVFAQMTDAQREIAADVVLMRRLGAALNEHHLGAD